MQAATVEVLVQKGKLDPPVALAVAEALDMAIGSAQLVTIPAMDSRFLASEAKVDARFKELEARMDARFAAAQARVDARFEATEARMDARLQKMKTDLIFWIIAAVVGNSYLPKIAEVIAEALRALH